MGRIYNGSGWAAPCVGRIESDGRVYDGPGWGASCIGRVASDGRVYDGPSLAASCIGRVDKDGKVLNVPEHEFSHSMDSLRYALASILKKPAVKTYTATQSPVLPYYGDRDVGF